MTAHQPGPFTPHHAHRFAILDPETVGRWSSFAQSEIEYFPQLVGLRVDEIKRDYCRMRLPWRVQISQPHGVGHGGAIATLIDSVVVPAIGSAYTEPKGFSTIDMHVMYLGAMRDEDAIAEGWVVQRGRSMVFCQVEVRGATSDHFLATGMLTYKLS